MGDGNLLLSQKMSANLLIMRIKSQAKVALVKVGCSNLLNMEQAKLKIKEALPYLRVFWRIPDSYVTGLVTGRALL